MDRPVWSEEYTDRRGRPRTGFRHLDCPHRHRRPRALEACIRRVERRRAIERAKAIIEFARRNRLDAPGA